MPTHTPVSERFWNFVTPLQADDCWLWTGSLRDNGYGQITDLGRTLKAHRVSFEIHHGQIPKGMYVLHSCDTPSCVNPRHLSLGTQKQNIMQASRRGRISSKISKAQARSIKDRVEAGESRRSIAIEIGVAPSTIGRIVQGRIHAEA